MFQRSDQVIYGIHGVCTIVDIEKRKIDRKTVEYYVLVPFDQPGSRYFVPTNNEAAVAKLRPMMTQQELDTLLKAEDAGADVWIEDENSRKQYYKELIVSGDRKALIQMVHTLHKQKAKLRDAGKKTHLCDENFLRDAQKILSSELSIVLHIDPGEVGAYMKQKLDNK